MKIEKWSECYGRPENAYELGVTGRLAVVRDGEYTWLKSTRKRTARSVLEDFASTADYTGSVTLRASIETEDGEIDACTATIRFGSRAE